MEWDTTANLDLFVWDNKLEILYHPSAFWYGWDFTSGYDGIEKIHFGIYEFEGQEYDLSSGLYDLLVRMENPGEPETNATLTILTVNEELSLDEISLSYYTFRFTPEHHGSYAWLPIVELDPETFNYSRKSGSEAILYLD